MDAAVALSESEAKTFYLVVAPGQHQGVSLELTSSNSYKAEIQIDGAVTFAPNTVYHKTVTVDPDTFQWFAQNEGDVPPMKTVYAPVATVEEIVDGEYVIGFLHNDGAYYVLPTAPVDRNPKMTTFAEASVEVDDIGNITGISDSYVWNVDSAGSQWSFTTNDGYSLIAANKAQGISVSNNLKGYYSDPYSDKWLISMNEGKIVMHPETSTTRYFSLSKDLGEYRLPGPTTEGTLMFYKKTQIAE